MVMVFWFCNVERDLDKRIEGFPARLNKVIPSMECHFIHPSFECVVWFEESAAPSVSIGGTLPKQVEFSCSKIKVLEKYTDISTRLSESRIKN